MSDSGTPAWLAERAVFLDFLRRDMAGGPSVVDPGRIAAFEHQPPEPDGGVCARCGAVWPCGVILNLAGQCWRSHEYRPEWIGGEVMRRV